MGAGTRLAGATALLSIVCLLLSACAAPWKSTPKPAAHASFTYSEIGSIDLTKTYRPGDAITFSWIASLAGTVHQEKPDQITLQAGLYGPFDTVDQLKQRMSSTSAPTHKPGDGMRGAAVTISPIQTDSWRNETYTSNLMLPSTLKPGYYSLVREVITSAGNQRATGEGQTVIPIGVP